MSDGKGYIVPDVVDPGDLYCFKVYIPRDVKYLAAFWGAYYFFGQWVAWARDPLKRGRQAAQVWRRAIDKAHDEFERQKGDCTVAIDDIRLNPIDSCDLQVKYEDSDTWVSKVDLAKSGCGGSCGSSCGAMRYTGAGIQQYNHATGIWDLVGPLTDIANDLAVAGQWPDTECGNGIAAANLSQAIEDGKNKMATAVGDALGFGALVLLVFEQVGALLPGLDVVTPAVFWLASAYDFMIAHYVEVAAFDLYEALSPVLPQYFNVDGSITKTNYDAMLAYVLEKSDNQTYDSAEHTAYGYAYSWIKCAGPAGVVKANKMSGITDFDCAAATWTHVFDLTLSNGGFVQVPDGVGGLHGHWSAGIGWVTEFGGIDKNTFRIGVLSTVATVTSIKASVKFDGPSGSGPFIVLGKGFSGGSDNSEAITADEGDWQDITYIATADLGGCQIGAQCDVDTNITLRSVEISGTGTDPYGGGG